MSLNHRPKLSVVTIIVFTILACGLPGNNIPTATEDSSPPAVSAAENSPIPGDTPTQVVIVPVDLPADRGGLASDMNSSPNAEKNSAPGGDRFTYGLLERPFNASAMDIYFPDIDIIETEGFKNDTWGVATITLAGLDANGLLSGNYAVELDLDRNGRGEWLILAENPSSTSWTVDGVRVYTDANHDVGSITPMIADPPAFGDGYETLVFDEGKGDAPDAAIVRIAPSNPEKINIAFRLSILGNPASFAMGVWAGNVGFSPALFDFNDNFTHEQAGSPIADLFVYPLKALAEIDNTCRMAINFFPTGSEPGICAQPIKSGDSGGVSCSSIRTLDECLAQGCGWWAENAGYPGSPAYCGTLP